MSTLTSAGARFRAALAAEKPLQIIGAINAYHAKLAEQVGYKALYLSGGGVAAVVVGVSSSASHWRLVGRSIDGTWDRIDFKALRSLLISRCHLSGSFSR